MSGDDPYIYPDSGVLRNKFHIHDAATLDRVERLLVVQRMREGVPEGNFDLAHLRAIHRHLFRDVYDWAGEVRTVEISKGGNRFQLSRYIDTGMSHVVGRLEEADYLRGLSPEDFAAKAGPVIGDVNYVHPFREGNGRAQMHYLQQLAEHAGHELLLEHVDPARWIEAAQASYAGDYGPMSVEIGRAMGIDDLQVAPTVPKPDISRSHSPTVEPDL